MAKKTESFRLRHLLKINYLSARLSEINSISDFFKRIANVLRYIGYRGISFYYKTRGFFVFVFRGIVNLQYAIRGKIIIAKESVYKLLRRIVTIPVYIGHGIIKVYYRIRGSAIIILAHKKTHNFIYWLGGVFIYTGNFLRNIYYGVKGFLKNKTGKFYNSAIVYSKNGLKHSFSWTDTLLDKRRDFLFKKGLEKMESGSAMAIERGMSMPPVKQEAEKLMRVLWLLHPFCNYKCSYCWLNSENKPLIDGEEDYIRKSPGEYSHYWDCFNQKYGSVRMEIAGGEPFLYSDFPEILSAVSRENIVTVTTNLSWDPALIIGKINSERVSFFASYHYDGEASVEKFIDKIMVLQRAGFYINVYIVAWPPHLSKLPLWLEQFYCKGIGVMVEPFIGTWNNRIYPQAYTDFDKKAIKDLNGGKYMAHYTEGDEVLSKCQSSKTPRGKKMDFVTSFQLAGKSPKGRFCNAGVSYIRVLYNGKVRRCFQGAYLGEFFSDKFHLLDKPEPCSSDECICIGENLCLMNDKNT